VVHLVQLQLLWNSHADTAKILPVIKVSRRDSQQFDRKAVSPTIQLYANWNNHQPDFAYLPAGINMSLCFDAPQHREGCV
jgi:hypothetical protein